jgi:hypothetical protein
MEYESRQFVVFDVSELSKIDFNQVLETSAETVRRSVDGTKTFVKWDGEAVPECVDQLTTKSEYITYTEIQSLMETTEWKSVMLTPMTGE